MLVAVFIAVLANIVITVLANIDIARRLKKPVTSVTPFYVPTQKQVVTFHYPLDDEEATREEKIKEAAKQGKDLKLEDYL